MPVSNLSRLQNNPDGDEIASNKELLMDVFGRRRRMHVPNEIVSIMPRPDPRRYWNPEPRTYTIFPQFRF